MAGALDEKQELAKQHHVSTEYFQRFVHGKKLSTSTMPKYYNLCVHENKIQ
jgi:hypothetical protein